MADSVPGQGSPLMAVRNSNPSGERLLLFAFVILVILAAVRFAGPWLFRH